MVRPRGTSSSRHIFTEVNEEEPQEVLYMESHLNHGSKQGSGMPIPGFVRDACLAFRTPRALPFLGLNARLAVPEGVTWARTGRASLEVAPLATGDLATGITPDGSEISSYSSHCNGKHWHCPVPFVCRAEAALWVGQADLPLEAIADVLRKMEGVDEVGDGPMIAARNQHCPVPTHDGRMAEDSLAFGKPFLGKEMLNLAVLRKLHVQRITCLFVRGHPLLCSRPRTQCCTGTSLRRSRSLGSCVCGRNRRTRRRSCSRRRRTCGRPSQGARDPLDGDQTKCQT